MSPGADMPHLVDVLLVDDSGSDPRGFRGGTKYLVTAAVPCRVIARTPKSGESMGREASHQGFRVLFPTDPQLTEANQLQWTRPGDGVVLYLRVTGTKRPQDSALPWVAYCDRQESGETPLMTAGLVQAIAGAPGGTASINITGNAATATALATTLAAGKLLGGQGTGVPAVVTVGSGLLLSGGTLTATGGGGSTAGLAPLDSPGLTGTPTAPTPGTNDSSTRLATTAFVQFLVGLVGGIPPNGPSGVVDPNASPYSAPIDGSSDASPGLQSVIDGIPSQDPTRVEFRALQYVLYRPFVVGKSNVILSGKGRGLTTLNSLTTPGLIVGDIADAANDGFLFSNGGRPPLNAIPSTGSPFIDSTARSGYGFSTQGGRTYLHCSGTNFDTGYQDPSTGRYGGYSDVTKLTIEWAVAPGVSGTLSSVSGASWFGLGTLQAPRPWALCSHGANTLAFAWADRTGVCRCVTFPMADGTVPHRGRIVLDTDAATVVATLNGVSQTITYLIGTSSFAGTGLMRNDAGAVFFIGTDGGGGLGADIKVLGFRAFSGAKADAADDHNRYQTAPAGTIAYLNTAPAPQPDRLVPIGTPSLGQWGIAFDSLQHHNSVQNVVIENMTIFGGILFSRVLDPIIDRVDCRSNGPTGVDTARTVTSYTLRVTDSNVAGAELAFDLWNTSVSIDTVNMSSAGAQVFRGVGSGGTVTNAFFNGFRPDPLRAVGLFVGAQGDWTWVHPAIDNEGGSAFLNEVFYYELPSFNTGKLTVTNGNSGPVASGGYSFRIKGPPEAVNPVYSVMSVNVTGWSVFGLPAPSPVYVDAHADWVTGTIDHRQVGGPAPAGPGLGSELVVLQ